MMSKGTKAQERKARQWLEQNQAALESSNAYVVANGLPLRRYRQFCSRY